MRRDHGSVEEPVVDSAESEREGGASRHGVVVGGVLRHFDLASLATFDPWASDPPNGLAYLDPPARAQRIDEDEPATSALALAYFASLGATLGAYRHLVAPIAFDAIIRLPWRRVRNAPYAAAARAERPAAANLSPCVTRLRPETCHDGDPRRALTTGELAPYVHVDPPLDPPLGDLRHLLVVDAVFDRAAPVGALWYALLAAGLSPEAEVTVATALTVAPA